MQNPSTWFEDALRRVKDRTYGCLPPAMPMGVEELTRTIYMYHSRELSRFNPVMHEDMPTMCETPYHILGWTSNGLIAFYGLNYIGAMPLWEIRGAIQREDRIARTAKRELVDLLRIQPNPPKYVN